MPRYLGQHFLINKNKLKKIVEALELKKNETVIEIGPGHGELTSSIRHQALSIKITAIEKDKKLVSFLQRKFALDKNIKIIDGDALKILPKLTQNSQLTTNNYKLAGNIPYYITGRLLRILSELKNKPTLIILTVQKEVAKRICALRQAQGKPRMNLLSASVQFWAKPKIIGYIPKRDFRPMPAVDSAVIKLEVKNREQETKNAEKYYRIIKILFKQPRKTIKNNLAAALGKLNTEKKNKFFEELRGSGIDPASRPQNLGVEDLLKIQSIFKKND